MNPLSLVIISAFVSAFMTGITVYMAERRARKQANAESWLEACVSTISQRASYEYAFMDTTDETIRHNDILYTSAVGLILSGNNTYAIKERKELLLIALEISRFISTIEYGEQANALLADIFNSIYAKKHAIISAHKNITTNTLLKTLNITTNTSSPIAFL